MFIAIGGVITAMAILTMSTAPIQIGLNPRATSGGTTMGVVITMIDGTSMKTPRMIHKICTKINIH